MSNRCTYPEIHYEGLESTILVEQGVIWDDQDSSNTQERTTIGYANSANTTLTETGNESYVTATGDNTQYFSVLESSNQTILNDISDATINTSLIQGDDIEETHPEENNGIDVNNGQVVLFKVDGSDELYGFQLIHDDDGNLQKYQFKVRQNIEGNLEAVPETLQILPVNSYENEDIIEEGVQRSTETFQVMEDGAPDKEQNVLVKEEHITEHLPHELNEEEILEEQLDSKEGILGLVTATTEKQELQEVANIESHEYDTSAHSRLAEDSGHPLEEEEEEEEIYYTHEDVGGETNFTYDDAVAEDPMAEDETPASEGHYEELFVKESHLMDDANGVTETNGIEHVGNLNDNEEYETVESIHITGDPDENMYEKTDIRKSPSYQASTIASRKKIIKNVIRKVKIQKNDEKANLYYLIKNPEKENMGRILSNSTLKPNPRSILKCSIAAAESQKYEEEEEKYDKRFAKSKEAQQARQFHNFIAQTKIIHAPIRQGRLPRKQQITPMKRTDEEIVVQEVVVSSNGVVKTFEKGALKDLVQLKPTEYIQLTDSDEDFDPKTPHKKKRKGKKRKPMVEITISDSDEESSDESLNDAYADNNLEETIISPVTLKRPRGRPPKHHDKDDDKEVVKRPRGRPPKYPKPEPMEPEEEIIVIKIDHRCPKCPKSFPSEGSLRSHMQYHNFCQTKSSDTKYMCEKCGDTFKNSFLLNRHINSHKTSNITCGNCKKVFNDQAQLAAHKKVHIKQEMFRNTTLPKDSPRNLRYAVKNKCGDCGKMFRNVSALNIHLKEHTHLYCQSCQKHFASKFTFGNHLRLYCVKRRLRSPKKQFSVNEKRLTNIRQSAITVPKKVEIPVVKPPIATASVVVTNIKCDSCSMTFATYTSLFKHKVLKHGLDSPSKSIFKERTTKSLHKNKTPHSGVKPSVGLKNAFMKLQSKLEAYKNSQKKT
ncbi:putative zinc finger protein [Trypoxylus dichotomus]